MSDFFAQFSRSLPSVWQGISVTLQATVLSALLALVLAFTFGLMAGSPHLLVRGLSRVVVEFLRGTSLYVQLFWLFFALPILGFKLEPLACAVVAFGLNYGAYGSEVVRGALNAVPRAQWEAAVALNMSPWQRMRRVLLPQAWVQMIPPFNNLLIQLLKCTPLMSLITISDLTFQMDQLRSSTGNTAAAYLTLLVIYFVLAYALTLLMKALEAVAKARLGQGTGLRRVLKPRPVSVSDPDGCTAKAGGV
ncbi:ectoine/hydroxyectoine ABC transporter permease subunit EhuC [Streptomyces sp. H10-C2]|uniref:ectoine/hydroxyectoine ABC transporter permease subunit EhuC n=1 Tax=unclassified Streptomyces TaxID=2593676 RepID=UPI0024BA88A5|nr:MULTISPECIES: ectoine/hydroxyectoine ABC transporter permease subunit EhuC [unclassified Streptomyces]MDJ0343573.1 ectoine/hydroxyectoine ABC transporter permease subunit EhuC [Streptomyces sp. PH10-H1]MDJ0368851.1 ectoine/hydroxyectoine ABC transporter permease subunit EhuC [Streptomyces sp. H10-C2]